MKSRDFLSYVFKSMVNAKESLIRLPRIIEWFQNFNTRIVNAEQILKSCHLPTDMKKLHVLLKWMYPVWSSENNRLSSFHVFSRAVIKWLFDISFCTKKAPLTSTQNMILTFYLEYDLMSRYTISPRLFFQWMQDTISSWIINITSFAWINIFLQFSSYIFHSF